MGERLDHRGVRLGGERQSRGVEGEPCACPVERAELVVRDVQRAAQVPHLDHQQRSAGHGAGSDPRDGVRSEGRQEQAVDDRRHGVVGLGADPVQLGGGEPADEVGPRLPEPVLQMPDGRHAHPEVAAGVADPDGGHRLAPHLRGQERQRREVHQRDRGRHLVRLFGGPCGVLGEDVLGVGHRVQQRAAVHHVQLDQAHLQRGDDAEVAGAALQPPEQPGVVGFADGDEVDVRVDNFGRDDRLAGEAEVPAEPAEAAAETVADDAHPRVGPLQADQAVPGRPGVQLLPGDARLHPGRPADGVDGHPLQRGRVDQQAAVPDRDAGAVAGGHHPDPEAGRTGVPDGGDHVLGRFSDAHQAGTVAHQGVPRGDGLVVARLARREVARRDVVLAARAMLEGHGDSRDPGALGGARLIPASSAVGSVSWAGPAQIGTAGCPDPVWADSAAHVRRPARSGPRRPPAGSPALASPAPPTRGGRRSAPKGTAARRSRCW